MKIAVATSSTGGHFFPAVAVIEAFKQKHPGEILFILPARSRPGNFLEKYPYPCEILRVSAPKKTPAGLFRSAWQMGAALLKSRKILRDFRPDFVLSVGGYGAAPVCLAAFFLKIPLVLLEPNLYPGLVNRLTARISRLFLAGFEKTGRLVRCRNFASPGIPVRSEFYGQKDLSVLPEIGLSLDRKVLLVVGGSQGARTLNNAVINILKNQKDPVWSGWQIIHSAGDLDYERVRSEVAGLNSPGYYPVNFLHPFWRYLKAADLVICRSGASTIGEIQAARVPAIFVPYPLATDNHQYLNAEALVEQGQAYLVPDDQLLFQNLRVIMAKIFQQPEYLDALKNNLAPTGVPAAEKIVTEILRFITKS